MEDTKRIGYMRFGEQIQTANVKNDQAFPTPETSNDGTSVSEHASHHETGITSRKVERMDGLGVELGNRVSEKFGMEFLPLLIEKGDAAVEYLFVKVADAVDWGDAKGLKVSEGAKVVMSSADALLTKMEKIGIPIPKKPAGIRVVSSVLGIAGCVPCCGVLWGLSALLLKRDPVVRRYFESKRSKLRQSYE